MRAGRLAQWLPPAPGALARAPLRELRPWAPAIGSSSSARSLNPRPGRRPPQRPGAPAGPPPAGAEAGAPAAGAAAGDGARGGGAADPAEALHLAPDPAGGPPCASVEDVAYLARSLRRRVVQRLDATSAAE